MYVHLLGVGIVYFTLINWKICRFTFCKTATATTTNKNRRKNAHIVTILTRRLDAVAHMPNQRRDCTKWNSNLHPATHAENDNWQRRLFLILVLFFVFVSSIFALLKPIQGTRMRIGRFVGMNVLNLLLAINKNILFYTNVMYVKLCVWMYLTNANFRATWIRNGASGFGIGVGVRVKICKILDDLRKTEDGEEDGKKRTSCA